MSKSRGELLQEVFDCAVDAVRGDPYVEGLRDLHGPKRASGGIVDPIRSAIGAHWDASQSTIGPILFEIRCGRCAMCIDGPPDGAPRLCTFAASDAVDAFKDGARQGAIEKWLARSALASSVELDGFLPGGSRG